MTESSLFPDLDTDLPESLFEDEHKDETPAEREARLATQVVLNPFSQAIVNDLVEKLVTFTNALTGHEFRPYQLPLAKRIFESLVIGDGALLTALYSRQSGKTETVANCMATAMLMLPRLAKAYPDLLRKFEEGVKVGTFAPVQDQTDIIFGRVVERLTSERAEQIMADPEINERIVAKGRTLKLRCGSEVTKNTAHPRASIEGHTFHVILIDECQGVVTSVVHNSIMPMATATRGTKIFTGTPGYEKNVFYNSIQDNKRMQNRHDAIRQNHFEVDWKEVSKYSEEYKLDTMSALLRLGEDSDEFRRQYCISPETRVLTADLQHIRAGDIHAGMRLAGFDENPSGKGLHRRFRESVVLSTQRVIRPSYALVFEDGTRVIASAEHQWVAQTAGRRTVWKTTERLTSTDRVMRLTNVWEPDYSYEAGYLAAALDGEGSLYQGTSTQLCFPQKENPMLDRVRKYLADMGISFTEHAGPACRKISIGHRSDIMRLLGQVRPVRLLPRFSFSKLGSIKNRLISPRLVSKQFLGMQEVIAIKTSSGTFIAEGLASHNCNQWMLEKGMFVTGTQLDRLGDPTMSSLITSFTRVPVVVGIDCGRKQDRTIVTVVYVDWAHPDQFGFYNHRILNWLDLEGRDWEDQYYAIMDFLRKYRIYKVGVDSNGLGDVVISRLRRMMPDLDFVDLGSSRGDQSTRWKHLRELLSMGKLSWPAHDAVKQLRTWRRFRQEMEDLEIEYNGPYVIGKAPKVADAHDDYPDSLAMACILSTQEQERSVEQSPNMLYGRDRRRY